MELLPKYIFQKHSQQNLLDRVQEHLGDHVPYAIIIIKERIEPLN